MVVPAAAKAYLRVGPLGGVSLGRCAAGRAGHVQPAFSARPGRCSLYIRARGGHGRGVAVCEVLGALTVAGAPLSSSKQRRLLAALAIAGGGVVSSDRLSDVVWDGEPPDTDNALQTYVSRLRTHAGCRLDRAATSGLRAGVAGRGGRCVAVRVAGRRRPGTGRRSRHSTLLEEALGLWRGRRTPSSPTTTSPGLRPCVWRSCGAAAAVARLDALLELGRPDEAAADAVRLIEADPYRESVWERRMRALHAAGRTVDAVRAFRDYRACWRRRPGWSRRLTWLHWSGHWWPARRQRRPNLPTCCRRR